MHDIWVSYIKQGEEDASLKLSPILGDYNAEFNAVAYLSHLYFGPKAKQALDRMGQEKGPWWEKDKKDIDVYFSSMFEGANYGVE